MFRRSFNQNRTPPKFFTPANFEKQRPTVVFSAGCIWLPQNRPAPWPNQSSLTNIYTQVPTDAFKGICGWLSADTFQCSRLCGTCKHLRGGVRRKSPLIPWNLWPTTKCTSSMESLTGLSDQVSCDLRVWHNERVDTRSRYSIENRILSYKAYKRSWERPSTWWHNEDKNFYNPHFLSIVLSTNEAQKFFLFRQEKLETGSLHSCVLCCTESSTGDKKWYNYAARNVDNVDQHVHNKKSSCTCRKRQKPEFLV